MSKLFEPSEINGMTLANRFVRSATWAGMATDEGACTPQLIDLVAELADGGVGLIITGHTYVHRYGQHRRRLRHGQGCGPQHRTNSPGPGAAADGR